MRYEDFLARFPGKRIKTSTGWKVICPAHPDKAPSLSVDEGEEGRILLNCFAECPKEAVVAAMGLEMTDLFADGGKRREWQSEPPPKRLLVEYEYTDAEGAVIYKKQRYSDKSFRFDRSLKGLDRVPYRLHELLNAKGRVFLTEGEKDTDNLAALGAVATTAGGSHDWRDEFAKFFGELEVVILPDNDEAGRSYATKAATAVRAHGTVRSLKVVELPGLPDKGDVSDWLAAGGTVQKLLSLCDAAPEWQADQPTLYGFGVIEYIGEEEPEGDDDGDFHVVGVLARGVPGVFGGEPKSGKTLLMEDLAISVALGEPDWCGFKIPERSRVLLMPREDSQRETAKRIWQMTRARGVDPRELEGYLFIDGISPFWFDEGDLVSKLRRSMERADVALIDSLSTVHRGDENSAKDMAKVASAWREASITDGKSVTLLHHFTKLNEPTKPGQSLRGSSAIYAHLRHVLGIRWANEQRTELELRADGNLAHRLEPTLIRLVAGVTAEGRKTVRFEFAGTVQDARAYAIDEAIITILRDAPDGLHGERIRELVRERVGENGVRNSTIDDRLRALSREQRIRRITPRAPWKLLDQ